MLDFIIYVLLFTKSYVLEVGDVQDLQHCWRI